MSRPWENENLRETDDRFPSGRWVGYWEQTGRLGKMELDLTFGGGKLFGDGRDLVGDFVLSGSYNHETGACTLHKAYLGRHGVDYDGEAHVEGIRGIWRIRHTDNRLNDAGLFHIWPLNNGSDIAATAEAHATVPANRD